MDFEKLLIGLICLFVGLIGIVWNSRRSAKDKKNRSGDYSIAKILLGSWSLVGSGIVMIILGILNAD